MLNYTGTFARVVLKKNRKSIFTTITRHNYWIPDKNKIKAVSPQTQRQDVSTSHRTVSRDYRPCSSSYQLSTQQQDVSTSHRTVLRDYLPLSSSYQLRTQRQDVSTSHRTVSQDYRPVLLRINFALNIDPRTNGKTL